MVRNAVAAYGTHLTEGRLSAIKRMVDMISARTTQDNAEVGETTPPPELQERWLYVTFNAPSHQRSNSCRPPHAVPSGHNGQQPALLVRKRVHSTGRHIRRRAHPTVEQLSRHEHRQINQRNPNRAANSSNVR